MKKLKHNDKVILEGKRGRVFTVRGCAKRYNGDAEAAYNRAIRNGHYLYYINKEPSLLCGDSLYAEKEKKKWEKAIQLDDGELVEIEDEILKVRYKGNYIDMGEFVYMGHTPIVKEFNVGDVIYYMKDNKVHCAPILSKMKVENEHVAHTDEQKDVFAPFGKAGVYYATVHGIINGEKSFYTKQELLDSL